MLWNYERSNQVLRIEARFDGARNEYVLTIRSIDRRAQTERFADAASFRERLDQLERQLALGQWKTRSILPLRHASKPRVGN